MVNTHFMRTPSSQVGWGVDENDATVCDRRQAVFTGIYRGRIAYPNEIVAFRE